MSAQALPHILMLTISHLPPPLPHTSRQWKKAADKRPPCTSCTAPRPLIPPPLPTPVWHPSLPPFFSSLTPGSWHALCLSPSPPSAHEQPQLSPFNSPCGPEPANPSLPTHRAHRQLLLHRAQLAFHGRLHVIDKVIDDLQAGGDERWEVGVGGRISDRQAAVEKQRWRGVRRSWLGIPCRQAGARGGRWGWVAAKVIIRQQWRGSSGGAAGRSWSGITPRQAGARSSQPRGASLMSGRGSRPRGAGSGNWSREQRGTGGSQSCARQLQVPHRQMLTRRHACAHTFLHAHNNRHHQAAASARPAPTTSTFPGPHLEGHHLHILLLLARTRQHSAVPLPPTSPTL